MSETLQIDELTVAVRRSPRRKKIELTVERDGGIMVAVPAAMELPAVERLVRQRLVTLYSALERKRQTLSVQPAKEYVTGEGFYYLGRKYRLKLIDDAPGAELRLHEGRFCCRGIAPIRAGSTSSAGTPITPNHGSPTESQRCKTGSP
jgi:predicted metal-dependent hydrolase